MIRATLARGDGTLPGDHYLCPRCGREAKFSVSRGRPDLCSDCRYVQKPLTAKELR